MLVVQHTTTLSMGMKILKTNSQSNHHSAKCTSDKPQWFQQSWGKQRKCVDKNTKTCGNQEAGI